MFLSEWVLFRYIIIVNKITIYSMSNDYMFHSSIAYELSAACSRDYYDQVHCWPLTSSNNIALKKADVKLELNFSKLFKLWV